MSLAPALLVMAGVSGCRPDSAPRTEQAGSGPAVGAGLVLVQPGVLTMCSDVPYEPFEFRVPGSDEYTGFDVDLMRLVADRLALRLAVRETPFTAIQSGIALEARQCDVLASAMTVTPERSQRVDFTRPYFDADQSLLVRARDAPRYRGLGDLAGRTVAVQTGTTGEQYARTNAPSTATIRSFDAVGPLFAALTAGEADAILQDYPVNAYRAQQDRSLRVIGRFPTGERYGFAVRKGNQPLLRALDEQVQQARASGDYERLVRRYFGDVPPASSASLTPRPPVTTPARS